ncbi:hypothetical protein ABZ128_10675 [Streptomyces sp. NPDC006326]|uniref:hypothetical protein n=1 Tax=Streptomyces sp. NPDC006326 TaxID=3156752 RepID=UPI0033A67C01
MTSGDTAGGRARRGRLEAAHVWTATLTGVVALGISLFNLAELQRGPDVDVTLPHVIRIEPHAPGGTVHLFVQPTIATRFRAEDVEIITNIGLHLLPAGKGQQPLFHWNEVGAWTYDFASNRLNYNRTADPSPLVVNQDKPQQPTFLFHSNDWHLHAGRYDGTLVLSRSSDRAPVKKPFCLDISKDALQTFAKAPERQFYELRNDVNPVTGRPQGESSCYAF